MHAWGTGCAGRRPAGRARPDGGRVWRRRRRGRRHRHRRRHRRGQEGRAGVTTSAGRGDKSFNDSAAAGLDAAKQKLGDKIEVKEIDPEQGRLQPQGDPRLPGRRRLRACCSGSASLFIRGHRRVGQGEHRRPRSPVVDVFDDTLHREGQNLTCLGFKEHEGSFIVGAAAALKTKSNTVGFVGGQEVELIKKFQAGYEAGVKYINETRRARTSRSWSTTPATPSEAFTRPGQGQGAGPEADRPGRRRASTTPPASTGDGVIAEPPPPTRSTPSGSTPTRA